MMTLAVWTVSNTNKQAAAFTYRNVLVAPWITKHQANLLAERVDGLQDARKLKVRPFRGGSPGWTAIATPKFSALLWSTIQATLGKYYEVKNETL